MYLSRLVLNARSRDARAWLTDCHALHRLLMSGFPTVTTGASPPSAMDALSPNAWG